MLGPGLECRKGCAALTQVILATECSQWDTMQQVPLDHEDLRRFANIVVRCQLLPKEI